MSKFIYLPVWYKGLLLEVLYSFSHVGEMVSINPETLVKKDELTQGLKYRYWSKFTLYSEYQNILQALPVTSIVLILLIACKLIWKIFNMMKLDCKFLNCSRKYIDYLYSMAMELSFVDLSFSCYFNLVSDYQTYHSRADNLGRFVSFVFSSALIYHYLSIGEKIILFPSKLKRFEKMIIFENLKSKELTKQNRTVNLLNIIFKLKIILLMACIIMFQNMVNFGLLLMLAI